MECSCQVGALARHALNLSSQPRAPLIQINQPPALALAAAHASFVALALTTRGSLAAQAALLAAAAAVIARGRALNAWLAGGGGQGWACGLPAFLAFPRGSWDAAGRAWAVRVAGPLLVAMLVQVTCLAAECWRLGVVVKRAQLSALRQGGGEGGGGKGRRPQRRRRND